MAIFELNECRGTLRRDGHEIEVTFSISVSDDGEIAITFQRMLLTAETLWLNSINASNALLFDKLELRGVAPDGELLESTSIFILRLNNHSTPTEASFAPTASAAALTVRYPIFSSLYSPATTSLEYLTVGLRAYGRSCATSPVGEVSVAASTDADFTKITGCIFVKQSGTEEGDLPAWFDRSDEFVRALLEFLSLADGRFIDWSARRFLKEGHLASITFYGTRVSNSPVEPLFSFLNMQPTVDLAVSTYISKVRDQTGLGIAIEWFVMHPRYTEAQYLAAMTALEHLIHVFVENLNGTILPKREFNLISKKVKEVLDSSLPTKTSEKMQLKLPELNRRTLRDSLDLLMNHYRVPLTGISQEQISAAISVRNKIVHRGRFQPAAPGDPSLLHNLSTLRELLKRIFLSMLNYEGKYYSYLGSHKWADFPPSSANE
jgi:hypothetical protein